MQRIRILNSSFQIKVIFIYITLILKIFNSRSERIFYSLKHFWRQGDDLHISFIAKLTCNRTEYTGTAWLV